LDAGDPIEYEFSAPSEAQQGCNQWLYAELYDNPKGNVPAFLIKKTGSPFILFMDPFKVLTARSASPCKAGW